MPCESTTQSYLARASTRLAIAALISAGVLAGGCSRGPSVSASSLLRDTWASYRQDFITTDGQVRDFINQGPYNQEHLPDVQTTSEGQSYAMLRAVWMDDRREFDLVWSWTRSHLQVRGDALFAWLWQPDRSGTGRVSSWRTAADADEDVALSLIFAGHRW